jgi:hypothetical protein
MNSEQRPKISEAKRRANRRYYQKRYSSDPDFRDKESRRISDNVMKRYNSNLEVREKMKKNALDRYYRLKAQSQAK